MDRLSRSAWVLNLDAERELETPGAHTPSADTIARMPDLVRALRGLLGHDGVVVDEDARVTREHLGRAWCPTPSALRRLGDAGATVLPAPGFDVLRRVNHRRFSADRGQTLPGARFAMSLDEVLETIAGESPTGHWLLKRPFGFAGRGRRRVAQGELDDATLEWVRASLRGGEGAQIEPWVERADDFAVHGFVSPEGIVTVGEPTRQQCDERGAWRATELATNLAPDVASRLRSSAELAANALHEAGYFGPFGVDAFLWRCRGQVALNPRSEINARYSMGWAVGMAERRVDLAPLP